MQLISRRAAPARCNASTKVETSLTQISGTINRLLLSGRKFNAPTSSLSICDFAPVGRNGDSNKANVSKEAIQNAPETISIFGGDVPVL